jgi:hypothetical protein
MKSVLIAASLLMTPLAFAASGALKEKAIAVQSAHKDSVLFMSAIVEIEVSAGDAPAKKEEKKVELLGTVIGADGLIVAPLSALDVATSIDGRTVNTQQGPMKLSAKSTTKEVKILLPDGSEVAAKVAFKDTDLDLAFIRPEKPEEVKLVPINTAETAPISLLDDVIVLGRLGKDLNRESLVTTSEVISILTKPRTFARITTGALGLPVFNSDGKFVGLGINRFPPKGDEASGTQPANVILPAADLMESAAQAK